MFGQNALTKYCADPNFDIIRSNCRDKKVLNAAMTKADIIIPLTALVGASMCKNVVQGAESINLGAINTH